jgi:magnesium-transporting ATPase (P-type)
MAICNTVNVSKNSNNEMDYEASSPDELALVKYS